MTANRTLLALGVLAAIVMLVGCKEQIGMPNSDVHTATTYTVYCTVADNDSWTGSVYWYQGYMTPDSAFGRVNPLITRSYRDNSGRAYPRVLGFCVFDVPSFSSPNEVPVCTLFYNQKYHNGSPSLLVNRLENDPRTSDDDDLFREAWYSTDTVAIDVTHDNDGWYKVPLYMSACGDIATIGAGGGLVDYYTGWVYTGSTSGDSTDVYGAGDYSPYIKVVYNE
jgi:hypothetical protein